MCPVSLASRAQRLSSSSIDPATKPLPWKYSKAGRAEPPLQCHRASDAGSIRWAPGSRCRAYWVVAGQLASSDVRSPSPHLPAVPPKSAWSSDPMRLTICSTAGSSARLAASPVTARNLVPAYSRRRPVARLPVGVRYRHVWPDIVNHCCGAVRAARSASRSYDLGFETWNLDFGPKSRWGYCPQALTSP